MYVYVYTYVYMYKYIYTYVFIYIHVYIHMLIYIPVLILKCISMHKPDEYVYQYILAGLHCDGARINIYHMYIYIQTYIFTY